MIFAERGNRVKQISEADIPKYVEQGYKITAANGAVIMDTVPTDITVLRNAYKEHVNEIKALKAQIELLTSELAKAETKKQKAEKTEDVVEPETKDEEPKKALVIEEQPKTTKSKQAKVVESAN